MEDRPTSAGKPVPRLPRGTGIRLARASLFRIAMFAILLVGVLALRQPCSEGIGEFIESFEVDAGLDAVTPGDAGPTQKFIHLTADMTDEELRAKLRSAGVDVSDPDAGLDANPDDTARAKP